MAAAVILRRGRLPALIDDSKRLTPRRRLRAFHAILEHAEVGVGIACAEEIDRHNIFQATLLAMQRAVHDLPGLPDLVLVDGPFAPRLAATCRPVIRGDQRSYVIACASIIAKVLRDGLMSFYHSLDPRYAFERHKGYGTRLHASRLAQCGPSLFHRRSFRPVLQASAHPADVDA